MKARAFTLLEVMVAVAILGLSLTVILSAQAGLYSSATYAHRVSVATGLARCRMSELEEKLLRNGYPEIDDKDEGPCCQDDDRPEMKCSWKVEKVELPGPPTTGGAGDGGISAGSDAGLSGGSSPGAPPLPGATGSGAPNLGPLSTLLNLSANPSGLSGDGGIGQLASTLKDGTAGGAMSMAPMVMGFVYPQLKLMMEASLRKVTVTVSWKEGIRSRDFTIVEIVTNPMKVGLPGALMGGQDGGVGFSDAGAQPNKPASGLSGGLGIPGLSGLFN